MSTTVSDGSVLSSSNDTAAGLRTALTVIFSVDFAVGRTRSRRLIAPHQHADAEADGKNRPRGLAKRGVKEGWLEMSSIQERQTRRNDTRTRGRNVVELADLAHLPHWVTWREEEIKRKDGEIVKTKIPYDPNRARRARQARIPTDPSTWGTRKEVRQAWRKYFDDGRPGGVGIVLGKLHNGVHLWGIDLDRCITKDKIQPWAREVIECFDTYGEYSPSGEGIKLFFRLRTEDVEAAQALLGFNPDGTPKTRKPFNAGNHREIAIDRARFYTVTDDRLNGIVNLRVVAVDDVRWLIEEAGPEFLAQHGVSSEEGHALDLSGSSFGFRFLADYKNRGESYDVARAAILIDQTEAGEWARRKGERATARGFAPPAGAVPMTERPPIEITVMPQAEDKSLYRACWADGDNLVTDIHEIFLDLMPFMLARKLLEWGYNVERELIVHLEGADYDLMRAKLGAAAATPLINTQAPVKEGTQLVYRHRHP